MLLMINGRALSTASRKAAGFGEQSWSSVGKPPVKLARNMSVQVIGHHPRRLAPRLARGTRR